MVSLVLIFRYSGEIAFTGKAKDPLDALKTFYNLNGWPPFLWVNGEKIEYRKNDLTHLIIDFSQNWNAYLADQ